MNIYWFVVPILLYNIILAIYQYISVKKALNKEVKVSLKALIVRRYMRLAKTFSLIGALLVITVLNMLVRGDMTLSGVLGYNGVGLVVYWGFIFHWFRIISAFVSWRSARANIEKMKTETPSDTE